MFGSHSKKRPNNLVVGETALYKINSLLYIVTFHFLPTGRISDHIIGRFYDYHLLDMIELGIENYQSRQKFKVLNISTRMITYMCFFLAHGGS